MIGTSSTQLPRVTRQDGETLVVLAPGCVEEVAPQLGRLGRTRAYVVTGSSLAFGRVGQTVRNALGPMMVGMFSGTRPHVPVQTAEQVANEARSLNADVLIGLGGGSPIGTAKAAVAHCVEGLYSNDGGDEERAMAVRAATLLVEHLPKAVARPEDLAHRYHLFEASMLAGLVLTRAGMGVHHGLCHVLGGRYNAPHGVLNAIILPHAMRFNLPIAGPAYSQLAPVFGLKPTDSPKTGEAVCRAMTDFIRQFRLPYRLRELGIPKTDLPAVAADALQSQSVRRNPRPLRDAQDVLQILEAAW